MVVRKIHITVEKTKYGTDVYLTADRPTDEQLNRREKQTRIEYELTSVDAEYLGSVPLSSVDSFEELLTGQLEGIAINKVAGVSDE